MSAGLLRDAFILNVMLSCVDGWYVLRQLKQDLRTVHIPVMMLIIVHDKKAGYSLGADDYLVKPVERKQLIKVLTRYARQILDQPVMLVEDDGLTREMMTRTIERQGWEVRCATDGVEGLALLEGGLRPGVILLDIMMPNMDGFEMLERLKGHPEWAEIPVIVVSAAVFSAEERAQLGAHVEQILQKGSYTPEQLVAEVLRAARN